MSEYETMTCAKCGVTAQCTPWFDFYWTHLWEGEGRVCETCFKALVAEHFWKEKP